MQRQFNNSKKSKKTTKRSRRRNRVNTPRASLTKFNPMPHRYYAKLTYVVTDIRVGNTTASTFIWGLFEFLNRRPGYSAQLYQVYKYCRIHSTTVDAEVINTGTTTPLKIVAAVLPFADTPATETQLGERPNSIYQTVGLSTGASKARIIKKYNSLNELGERVYSKDYWCSVAQSTSTTPQDVNGPVIQVSVFSVDEATAWSGNIYYKVSFDCEFFDLLGVALS